MHLICVQYHLSLFTSPQSSHESLEYVCTTIIGEQNPKLHLRETNISNGSVSVARSVFIQKGWRAECERATEKKNS